MALSARTKEAPDLIALCRHRFEGVFDMHGVKTGSVEDLAPFVEKLKTDRYLAMDFWDLALAMERLGEGVSPTEIRATVVQCVGRWGISDDDPSVQELKKQFEVRLARGPQLHESARRTDRAEGAEEVVAGSERMNASEPHAMGSNADDVSELGMPQPGSTAPEIGAVASAVHHLGDADHHVQAKEQPKSFPFSRSRSMDDTLSRLELNSHELRLHLDEIDHRMSRMEPHLDNLSWRVGTTQAPSGPAELQDRGGIDEPGEQQAEAVGHQEAIGHQDEASKQQFESSPVPYGEAAFSKQSEVEDLPVPEAAPEVLAWRQRIAAPRGSEGEGVHHDGSGAGSAKDSPSTSSASNSSPSTSSSPQTSFPSTSSPSTSRRANLASKLGEAWVGARNQIHGQWVVLQTKVKVRRGMGLEQRSLLPLAVLIAVLGGGIWALTRDSGKASAPVAQGRPTNLPENVGAQGHSAGKVSKGETSNGVGSSLGSAVGGRSATSPASPEGAPARAPGDSPGTMQISQAPANIGAVSPGASKPSPEIAEGVASLTGSGTVQTNSLTANEDARARANAAARSNAAEMAQGATDAEPEERAAGGTSSEPVGAERGRGARGNRAAVHNDLVRNDLGPRGVSVSSGVMAANLVSSPPPDYPMLAKMTHIQGPVVLQVFISKRGTVDHINAVKGPRLLRGAAKSAVRKWRYRPYAMNGHPVEVATVVTVDFKLGK